MSTQPAFIYHVVRNTDDPNQGGSSSDIVGSYWTLAEANAVARNDLISGWGKEFFQDYGEEVDRQGMVSISGQCPEGEVITVVVRKKPAPKPLAATSTIRPHAHSKPSPGPRRAASEAPAVLSAVWLIVQTDYEDPTDDKGRTRLSKAYYDTVKEANEDAREALAVACGRRRDDDLTGIRLEGEKNLGSNTEEYEVTARVHHDKRDHLTIQVKKFTVRRAAGSSPAWGTKWKAPAPTESVTAGEAKKTKTGDAAEKSPKRY